MKEFIANLPKAELHLHIEGTLEPQTILKLAKRNKIVYVELFFDPQFHTSRGIAFESLLTYAAAHNVTMS